MKNVDVLLRLEVSDDYAENEEKLLDYLEHNVNDYAEGIFLSDFIPCLFEKVWVRDDIKSCLADKGYEDSENNVDAVINTGLLKTLADCTDTDWEIIYNAIDYAHEIGDVY